MSDKNGEGVCQKKKLINSSLIKRNKYHFQMQYEYQNRFIHVIYNLGV